MIDIPGFQVEEKIYESVHSVVYRAKQIEGDRPVILKTLKEEYPVPQEILRYRQEYETTRSLNDCRDTATHRSRTGQQSTDPDHRRYRRPGFENIAENPNVYPAAAVENCRRHRPHFGRNSRRQSHSL